jgi:glycine/D-amino acid oxidase-like deaminating enzyme
MTRLDDGATRLTNGKSVWQAARPRPARVRPPVTGEVLHTDVVIIGAGVTGAFLAERFSRDGHTVVLLDGRPPAQGSTSASTAMLLWELDASLLELEGRIGMERPAGSRTHAEAWWANGTVLITRIACDHAPVTLYLTGLTLDAGDLRQEKRLRDHLDIEGALLGEADLAVRGIVADAALDYAGSAEADPMRLALGLLAAAEARGALILSPATATAYHTTQQGVIVETDAGSAVHARVLVLATGYEMPDFVPAARHTLASSWSLATPPLGVTLARRSAYQSIRPLLYMRLTGDGRLVIGGEDEESDDPQMRERLTPQKVSACSPRRAKRPRLDG